MTDPGGVHPSAWAVRGFLLEGAASMSVGHEASVDQLPEWLKSEEATRRLVPSAADMGVRNRIGH